MFFSCDILTWSEKKKYAKIYRIAKKGNRYGEKTIF